MRLHSYLLCFLGMVVIAYANVFLPVYINHQTDLPEPMPGDCGPVALVLISQQYNRPLSLPDARRLCNRDSVGTSMYDLKMAAEAVGFIVKPLKLSYEALVNELETGKSLAVLFCQPGHYYAVTKLLENKKIRISDNFRASIDVGSNEIKDPLKWKGECLLFYPDAAWETLAIHPRMIDLGTVFSGDSREFVFSLRNTTQSSVFVSALVPGCGCTKTTIDNPRIQSQDVAKVTGLFQAPSEKGKLLKRMEIHLSKPAPTIVYAWLQANISQPIEIASSSVVLSPDLTSSQLGQQEISLKNNSTETVTVYFDQTSGTIRSDRQSIVIPPQSANNIYLTCPSNVVQKQTVVFSATTSHALQRSLSIPVRINPKLHVAIAPERINFGLVSRSRLQNDTGKMITLRGNLMRHIHVETLKAPKGIECSLDTTINPDEMVYRVKVTEEIDNQTINETISIKWNSIALGINGQFTVPLSGLLRD